jgi:hypothetical protein
MTNDGMTKECRMTKSEVERLAAVSANCVGVGAIFGIEKKSSLMALERGFLVCRSGFLSVWVV